MQTKKNSIPFYYILNKTTMANEIDIISFKIVIVVVTSSGSNHNLMVTIWNAMFHWNDMPTHTSCTQNIMDEKWGHSMVNSFDIKMMVKGCVIEIVFKFLVD